MSVIYLTHLTHDMVSIKILDERYKAKFSPAVHYFLLGPNILCSTLTSIILFYFLPLNTSDHVSQRARKQELLQFCTNFNLYVFRPQMGGYKILKWIETSTYKEALAEGHFRSHLCAIRG
jgi:hypothetical protein